MSSQRGQQAHHHLPVHYQSDGILGGAFVVVGFVVLVVIATVDLIAMRWVGTSSTTTTTAQTKDKDAKSSPNGEEDARDSDDKDVSPEHNPHSTADIDDPAATPTLEMIKETNIHAIVNLEPTVELVHEIALATDSSLEWVALSKHEESVASIFETAVIETSPPIETDVKPNAHPPYIVDDEQEQEQPQHILDEYVGFTSPLAMTPDQTPSHTDTEHDDPKVFFQDPLAMSPPLTPSQQPLELKRRISLRLLPKSGAAAGSISRRLPPSRRSTLSNYEDEAEDDEPADEIAERKVYKKRSLMKKSRTLMTKVFKNPDDGREVSDEFGYVRAEPGSENYVAEWTAKRVKSLSASSSRVSLRSFGDSFKNLRKKEGSMIVPEGSQPSEEKKQEEVSKVGEMSPRLFKSVLKSRKTSK